MIDIADIESTKSDERLKDSIRYDFKRFREKHDLKSTWDEREEVVRVAFKIIKEDMLINGQIEKEYSRRIDDAKTRMDDRIKLYMLFRQDFEKIGCEDFVDIVIKYGVFDNIEQLIVEYLKNKHKETTLNDEEIMVRRARQIVHKHLMTPDDCKRAFEDDCKEILEWKRKKTELSKIVNEKVMASKFKQYFIEIEKEKLKNAE